MHELVIIACAILIGPSFFYDVIEIRVVFAKCFCGSAGRKFLGGLFILDIEPTGEYAEPIPLVLMRQGSAAQYRMIDEFILRALVKSTIAGFEPGPVEWTADIVRLGTHDAATLMPAVPVIIRFFFRAPARGFVARELGVQRRMECYRRFRDIGIDVELQLFLPARAVVRAAVLGVFVIAVMGGFLVFLGKGTRQADIFLLLLEAGDADAEVVEVIA